MRPDAPSRALTRPHAPSRALTRPRSAQSPPFRVRRSAQVVTFTIYESLSKVLQRTLAGRAAVGKPDAETRIQRMNSHHA
eukprot:6081890-Prymnesium_polylepis.1